MVYAIITSYVSIQIFELNVCAKLEYRIKHMQIKHRFHSMSQKEVNNHFLETVKLPWNFLETVGQNITKNIGEATEYNNFHLWHNLLVTQS